MIYPIYGKKRCHPRDQIGAYDDSGYVYKGKKPSDSSVAGRFDPQGRICSDPYLRDCVGVMKDDGVGAVQPDGGETLEGRADREGVGAKGVSYDVPVAWVLEGTLRREAAAAALVLLRKDVPADARAKGRFEDLPRWLEVVLDLALEAVELVIDIVT